MNLIQRIDSGSPFIPHPLGVRACTDWYLHHVHVLTSLAGINRPWFMESRSLEMMSPNSSLRSCFLLTYSPLPVRLEKHIPLPLPWPQYLCLLGEAVQPRWSTEHAEAVFLRWNIRLRRISSYCLFIINDSIFMRADAIHPIDEPFQFHSHAVRQCQLHRLTLRCP